VVVQYALAVLEVVAPSPLILQTVVTLRVAVDAKPLALALDLVALEGGPISQGLAHLAAGPIVYNIALLLCLLRFPSQGSPLAATVNVLVDYRRVVQADIGEMAVWAEGRRSSRRAASKAARARP
jgi:hypothetical protein